MTHYILDGDGTVRGPVDLMEWARWYEANDRNVAQTSLPGAVHVSTVFLGINHAFLGGPPLLFETMIFGGRYDQYQWRYSTVHQARAGHDQIVAALKAGEEPNLGGAT